MNPSVTVVLFEFEDDQGTFQVTGSEILPKAVTQSLKYIR